MTKKKKSISVKSNSDSWTLSDYKLSLQARSEHTLALLANRLSRCRLALKEYGTVPTSQQLIDEISSRLKKAKEEKKSFEELIQLDKIKAFVSTHERKLDFDFDDYYRNIFKNLGNENLYDSQILEVCGDYCHYLPMFASREGMWSEGFSKLIDYMKLETYIIQISCEALGYWTAKLEERIKNETHGAKAMKDKGNKNKEAIRQVMKEQNITSMDFRGDKNKREIFYETAKKRTKETDTRNKQSLTESRIQKIGRQILKEDKPPS
ncbi:MAG TPA: hypothetical protein PK508_01805 [Candidatus Paceibacterota bacterium]|nr:hypothetical protein [Candidatus Paceibacterota bacterium]